MKLKKQSKIFILFIILANIFAIKDTSELLAELELNTIAICDAQAFVDSNVTLQIDVENHEEFVAFQFDLILPDGLDYIENTAQLTDRAQDHIIQVSYIGQDTLRIISFSMNMLPFLGTSGTVAELEFEVNLDEGFYPLILSNGLLANINSENILDEMINGQLEVLALYHILSENIVPRKFSLSQNYPNPFNPETTIQFTTESTEVTELIIYNIKGQKVKTLECGESLSTIADGVGYSISWNGTDDNNQSVSSGIYLYQIKAGKHVKTRKMLLLK